MQLKLISFKIPIFSTNIYVHGTFSCNVFFDLTYQLEKKSEQLVLQDSNVVTEASDNDPNVIMLHVIVLRICTEGSNDENM